MTNETDRKEAKKRLTRMKIRSLEKKMRIPPPIRRSITMVALAVVAMVGKAQTEKLSNEFMEAVKDTVEQTVPTIFQMFQADRYEKDCKLLQTYQGIMQEWTKELAVAEQGPKGAARNARISATLERLTGEKPPKAVLGYHCAYTFWMGLKKAATLCDMPEYVEFVDTKLSNGNYCPTVKNEMTAYCKEYGVDMWQGKTCEEIMASCIEQGKPTLLLRIRKSPRNSRSGLHIETRSSKMEDNCFVKDEETGAVVIVDAGANQAHYKEVTQDRSVAVADFNVIDVVEAAYRSPLLAQFSKEEALRRSGMWIETAQSQIAKADIKEIPQQRVKIDPKAFHVSER